MIARCMLPHIHGQQPPKSLYAVQWKLLSAASWGVSTNRCRGRPCAAVPGRCRTGGKAALSYGTPTASPGAVRREGWGVGGYGRYWMVGWLWLCKVHRGWALVLVVCRVCAGGGACASVCVRVCAREVCVSTEGIPRVAVLSWLVGCCIVQGVGMILGHLTDSAPHRWGLDWSQARRWVRALWMEWVARQRVGCRSYLGREIMHTPTSDVCVCVCG